MGRKLQDLVRRVIAGSLSSLAVANLGADATAESPTTLPTDHSSTVEDKTERENDLRPKLLLKIKAETGEWSYTTHRSHRSHSSHRSHYSSRVTSPPPSTSTPQTNRSLGSRTLKKYDSGTDVTELVLLLINRQYLSKRSLDTREFFSTEVEQAVIAFQRDHNLEPDGAVGSSTVAKLKAEPAAQLGSRTLKRGMIGEDVAELMQILIRRKYLTARGLKQSETFTEEVENALKAFQGGNNMNPTGIADPATILLLKHL